MNIEIRKFYPWLKTSLKKLFLLRASAHEIAFGIAIGIFIGIFPTFGLGVFIILGIAPLIRFNVPAALIGGALLANPLFAPVWIFFSCWIVGIDFSSIKSSEETIALLFKHYSKIIGLYVAGNAIVSAVVAAVFYGITYGLTSAYRKYRPSPKLPKNIW